MRKRGRGGKTGDRETYMQSLGGNEAGAALAVENICFQAVAFPLFHSWCIC